MKSLTEIMAILGAFGTSDLSSASNARVPYPYGMGEKHTRVRLSPHYRKKGPGRRHIQGKTNNRHRRLSLATWNKP